MDTFGAGALFAVPINDAFGNQYATPSPVQFGILQDVTIDDSAEIKELYSADQYPVDIGRGKGKIMIKAKFASINALLFNSVYYGQTLVAGYDALYNDLLGTTVPGTAGATSVNVVAPTGGNLGGHTSLFVRDLGVQAADPYGGVGGVPFTRVASNPTSGQYVLTTGAGGSGATYTFAGQDVGKTVFINYEYTNAYAPSTDPSIAQTMTVVNLPMGSAPVFSAVFMAKRQTTGETWFVRFPNVVATKLTRDFKNDDFTIPDFEASAFADSLGNVEYMGFYV
jgi:hypothetical protein